MLLAKYNFRRRGLYCTNYEDLPVHEQITGIIASLKRYRLALQYRSLNKSSSEVGSSADSGVVRKGRLTTLSGGRWPRNPCILLPVRLYIHPRLRRIENRGARSYTLRPRLQWGIEPNSALARPAIQHIPVHTGPLRRSLRVSLGHIWLPVKRPETGAARAHGRDPQRFETMLYVG